MGDTRPDDERLPWLDSPRAPAVVRAANAAPAPRRSATPLLVLLSLFILAGVGVMAFLAGRGSVPLEESKPAPGPVVRDLPAPAAVAPAPVAVESAPQVVEARPAPAPAPRTERKRRAAPRKLPDRPLPTEALDATLEAQGEGAAAAPTPAPVAIVPVPPPVRYYPPPPPLVRASSTVQVGTYRTRAQAEAAHRRLAKNYPYMRRVGKIVRPFVPRGSRRSFYRLQYQAGSPEYARVLCRNLKAIGRGCAVLPAGR